MTCHRRSPLHRSASRSIALACAFATHLGCGETGNRAPSTARSDSSDSATERPAPSQDTLRVEGAPQVLPVGAWTTPDGFPLPFRTIVPDTPRLAASVEDIGEGSPFDAAVRFDWAPASEPAFLRLVVLRAGTDSATAASLARGAGTDFGLIGSQGMEWEEAVPRPGHEWAFMGYRLRGGAGATPVTGWLSMGQRGGRYFYLMALYPPEYGDGLAPRFAYVLRNWRWLDPETPLSGS